IDPTGGSWPRAGRARSKVRDKLRMLGSGQPLPDHVQNLGNVTRDQSGRVEPEAWKCRTAIMALLVRIEKDERAIAKDKPVDLSILHPPDDVFTDAATTIDVKLEVQVDADST